MSTRKQLRMTCRTGKYQIFEIIELDDEKWIVTQIHQEYKDKVTIEPLYSFVAHSHYIDVDGTKMTLFEYIKELAEGHLRNHRKMKGE